jgi:hypothetical protein
MQNNNTRNPVTHNAPEHPHKLLRPPVDPQDVAVEEHQRGPGRVDLGAVEGGGGLHAQVERQLSRRVGRLGSARLMSVGVVGR